MLFIKYILFLCDGFDNSVQIYNNIRLYEQLIFIKNCFQDAHQWVLDHLYVP